MSECKKTVSTTYVGVVIFSHEILSAKRPYLPHTVFLHSHFLEKQTSFSECKKTVSTTYVSIALPSHEIVSAKRPYLPHTVFLHSQFLETNIILRVQKDRMWQIRSFCTHIFNSKFGNADTLSKYANNLFIIYSQHELYSLYHL